MAMLLTRAAASALLLLTAVVNLASNSHVVRVLTYNIHHGEGTDREFDLVRIAAIITSADPDLVALQEVDQGTTRSARVDQLTELGRLTGMHAAFGKAMDFQGGSYGVGVLSRLPILRTDNQPLPGPPGREPRTALTVDIQLGASGRPVIRFTSTHLDSGRDADNRAVQADHLNRILATPENYAAILAGDMNARPDADVMQILGTHWTNASAPEPSLSGQPTSPVGRVDYILVRPAGHWRVVESRTLDAPIASDHRPVLAVLEWDPKP
jgi:endonuclease/exonuclease/phosphatase family metal-dependent hydrolase